LQKENTSIKGKIESMNSFSKTKEPGKPTVFLVQENPYINVLGAAEYGLSLIHI
jgi:hypothetical protein